MATLIRVDKNGTKYYRESKCPKCGGSGYLSWYTHVEGGLCFLCGGTGIHEHGWKEYTPEYEEKLRKRRLEKALKEAPERNAKLWKSVGLADDGGAWIVVNKYAKADEMKPLGARWTPALGWFFKDEHEGTFHMTADELGFVDESGSWGFKRDVDDIVDKKRDDLLPKSESEYVGKVGEKLEVKAEFEFRTSYETHFSWCGETVWVLKFKADGNTLVWKTECPHEELESGVTYVVKGTVKEQKEYKGDKQTVLTRCKVA